jgi:GDP-mannose 6-dehydrogenase
VVARTLPASTAARRDTLRPKAPSVRILIGGPHWCRHSEFLRESTSVKDYFDPGRTVIGEFDKASGDAVAELYAGIPGKVFRVSLGSAAMIKYLDNSWHAVKVGFGNEVGALAKAHGIDSHELIEVFLADEKLNLGPVYLRPGFAFGSSCLPKDLRGITYAARQANVAVPILEHVLPSNEEHLKRALDLVLATDTRKIAVFGLSFKPGTDDMRESPMVELVERLIGKGYDLKIYDANVSLSRVTGANKAYMDERLPHLGELFTMSLDEVKAHSDVAVAGTTDPDVFATLPTYNSRTVIDLVRIPADVRDAMSGNVIGLAW